MDHLAIQTIWVPVPYCTVPWQYFTYNIVLQVVQLLLLFFCFSHTYIYVHIRTYIKIYSVLQIRHVSKIPFSLFLLCSSLDLCYNSFSQYQTGVFISSAIGYPIMLQPKEKSLGCPFSTLFLKSMRQLLATNYVKFSV